MRLPRSSPSRTSRGFHRLLTAVDLYAPAGLQFVGQLATPGAEFRVEDLPRPAVLLENAGSIRTAAAQSRYSFENLWVLWQFDFERSRWVEVVRITATDASWTIHVAPIAHRLLHPYPQPPAAQLAAPAARHLTSIIRLEVEKLSREIRCYVLAELDRYVANEIVAATAELSIRPAGRDGAEDGAPRFSRLGAHRGSESGVLRPPARL